MPEGDTIHRTARALDRALAGRAVTRFASVFVQLTRIDADAPVGGRTVERVEARGKHLLIWFSGDLVLHTHMRMHGSWHLYRPGERWRRPQHEMRIVIETSAIHAVAFNVPVAGFASAARLARLAPLDRLGPDLLAPGFSPSEGARRIAGQPDVEIGNALLDQAAIAGIGNIYKSEALFAARVDPFARVGSLPLEHIERVVTAAMRLMRANAGDPSAPGAVPATRSTTGRPGPGGRYWVYGRGGKPCRRCGTPILRRKQGEHARSTYWCARCQGRSQ